jgi:hypothetical protein
MTGPESRIAAPASSMSAPPMMRWLRELASRLKPIASIDDRQSFTDTPPQLSGSTSANVSVKSHLWP